MSHPFKANRVTVKQKRYPFIAVSLLLSSHAVFASQTDEFQIFNWENECRGCLLTGDIFAKDTLRSTRHVNAYLKEAYLIDTLWEGINLQGAAFHDVHGDRMRFSNCYMRHTNLSYSELPYLQMDPTNHLEAVNFIGSGLEYSNFSWVTLDKPFFTKTVLEGANFSNAKIYDADFTGARLTDADFTDAWVRNSDFTNASLRGVDFTRADLRDSKITAEQLAKAKSLCAAILPDGSRGGCE